ncbi:MAG: HTH domain-containing protein [Nanoarchaeota archaeon]|nr:HTH domain-containing protein [Nanoarchaeota archaeon]
MVDFACTHISIDNIIKCSFGLTKTELEIFRFLVTHKKNQYTTQELSQELALDITTIQKAVKKLTTKGVLKKSQKNLEQGGYVLLYECIGQNKIKEIIMNNFENFSKRVEQSLCNWK